jgi:hypothetical protein
MKQIIKVVLGFILLLPVACIEPFPVKSIVSSDHLVIEGIITNEMKNQRVYISHTSSLDNRAFIPEEGAQVTVEKGNGETITLTETKPGIYETGILAGTIGEKYKLKVRTAAGRDYVSSEVTMKTVPAIDDIYAKFLKDDKKKGRGIQIYLDTEDASNKTTFYRWDCVETYEVQTPFPSNYQWLGGNNVVFREHSVSNCWATDTIRNILLTNTSGLKSNKVSEYPIRFIAEDDYRFGVRYSVVVRQFALTQEGYSFWNNLKIVNETQGSLSDVQPGSVTGNITSLHDAGETVLGYFDASAVSEKRVFFSYQDFEKDGYQRPTFRSSCFDFVAVEVAEGKIGDYMQRNEGKMVIWETLGSTPDPIFFLMMPKRCCDCSDLGTTERPPFWQ